MLKRLILLISIALAITPATKIVKFKLYVTANAREAFLKKGRTVEESLNSVISELETTLDTFLLQLDTPMKIKFEPLFTTELPPGIDLDKCGTDLIEIGDMLNFFNDDDSLTSTIAILSCRADAYNDAFTTVGQKVPYVGHNISTECTTRTVIFLETEEPKFLSVFSTALIRAAGVNLLNPLVFEEVTDGDQGVRYEIRVSNDTINAIKQNRCFYSV